MLKTLDTYIDKRPTVWSNVGRDRRFTFLLAVSVVVHVIFYAALIKLDSAMMRAIASGRSKASLVKLIELAPPPDRAALRTAPEPLERADINRLQFDPATADDVHLVARSPKPSTQKGNAGRLPSADQIERQLRASRGSGGRDRNAPTSHQPALPETSSIQANRIPVLDEAMIAQTPPMQAVPAPPSPAQKQDVIPNNTAGSDATAAGVRRGNRSESSALGLEAAQGQYMALVRAKIRKANERIMPREWIKDILRDKVSADFLLVIKRDGQILTTRLARSTGYQVLDDYARQAIYTASPFEGFPQAAGDALTFTVTVYFFTL
ncbi:MAG: TonB C-terminal domain-containing protein [Acidobacteriota bacterium]